MIQNGEDYIAPRLVSHGSFVARTLGSGTGNSFESTGGNAHRISSPDDSDTETGNVGTTGT